MKTIKYFLLFFILIIPIGELGRLKLGETGINAHVFDILLALLLFGFLIFAFGIKKKFFLPPLTLPLVLFLTVALVSLWVNSTNFSTNELMVSSLYLVRLVLYCSLYFITYNILKNDGDTGLIIRVLIGASLVIAILGYLQYIFIPDFSEFAESDGWDPHQQRVLSTFFDPNFLAAYFNLVLIVLFAKILFNKNKREFWFATIAASLVFPALILTYSRSGYLAFAVVVLLIGILRSRLLLVGAIILSFSAFLLFPRISERIQGGFSLDESASARIVSWQNAMEVVTDNPIIGVGYNTYRYTQERYGFLKSDEAKVIHSGAGTDSSLLLVVATTGIIGLTVFVLGFFKELRLAVANLLNRKMIGLVTVITLVSLAVSSQFVNALFFPQIMAWYFIIFALNDFEAEKKPE